MSIKYYAAFRINNTSLVQALTERKGSHTTDEVDAKSINSSLSTIEDVLPPSERRSEFLVRNAIITPLCYEFDYNSQASVSQLIRLFCYVKC